MTFIIIKLSLNTVLIYIVNTLQGGLEKGSNAFQAYVLRDGKAR